jgi:hypothetical protein
MSLFHPLEGLSQTLLVIGAVGVWSALRTRKRSERASGWPTVPGVITRSGLRKGHYSSSVGHGNAKSTVYTPHIAYSYEVGGKRFEGERVQFGTERRMWKKLPARAAIDAYPVGAEVQVHYDPRRPEDAVLTTGVGAFGRQALLFSLGMMILGAVGWTIALL